MKTVKGVESYKQREGPAKSAVERWEQETRSLLGDDEQEDRMGTTQPTVPQYEDILPASIVRGDINNPTGTCKTEELEELMELRTVGCEENFHLWFPQGQKDG